MSAGRSLRSLLAAAACLAGCGDDGGAPVNLMAFRSEKWITISNPTSGPLYLTDHWTVDLSGGAEPDEASQSGMLVITDPPRVTWSNSLTGATGTANTSESFSGVRWSAPGLFLVPGDNTFIVTAVYSGGEVVEDEIVVTQGDLPPRVTVDPSSTSGVTAVPLRGTAEDAEWLSSVSWTNAATGLSGIASGTKTWSATVGIAPGIDNIVTVTAVNENGQSGTATVTLRQIVPSFSLTITTPTSAATYTTFGSLPLSLGGSAAEPLWTLTWVNATTGQSGSGAVGSTSNRWTADVPLTVGVNQIEIIGRNFLEESYDVLSVTRLQ